MFENIAVYPGNPKPLGFSVQGKRANFALFSSHASLAILGLSLHGKRKEIKLNRTGDVWHRGIEGWTEEMEYAFRVDGPQDVKNVFDPDIWLADPASKFLTTSCKWGDGANTVWSRCKEIGKFDWQNVKRPAIGLSELVIYEMHVRGLTRRASVSHPGTFLGIIEKIPYLRKLGINTVEFLPIFEFDETRCNPKAETTYLNYWGYDPLSYFSPMRRYAASDNAIDEFKTLIRELHRNGIEAILDVVYNHTGEAGDKEYRFSFRGIDNSAYYMVDEQGNYRNFTGCRNTVNANHPAVQEHILSSLRFWAGEMQVDGFRFDLASILTRGPDGKVLKAPPLLQKIAADPLLKDVKLISESWDAAGLYQVGQFPDFGPWCEWNGQFRDRVRNFMKGTDGFAGKFAEVFTGSQFLYRSHSPLSSINFVTAHDGYSLNDLVSYNKKYNEANGQDNRDGSDENFNWNCGAEGPTEDAAILELRQRQMRNFLLALFLSQGIPMLLMGDEYGHTRRGNNNPFVQDSEINWFLWDELEKNKDKFEFTAALIAFRKAHPALRRSRFLTDADVDWHGTQPFHPDWNSQGRLVALTLKGQEPLYIAFNADFRTKQVALPPGLWREIVRTDRPWNENHLKEPDKGPQAAASVELIPYSALLATSES